MPASTGNGILPRPLGFLILALPIAAAVAFALWLAAAAAFEDIRFARSADQILGLIVQLRDTAKDPNFGQQTGENIITALTRRGTLPGSPGSEYLVNAWGGTLMALATQPSLVRIESEMPVRDCRRLGFFFGRQARDLMLAGMEAREQNGSWRQFYNGAAGDVPTVKEINAACGQAPQAALAIMMRLR